jgi:peroxiredoxin
MSKWKLRSIALVIVAAAALLYGCSGPATVRASVKAEKDRKPAPNFTLTDASGKQVKLSDFKGKVVLLNFWATWCGPCKVEIPWFIEFQQTYKDRDFVVLGVSFDDDGWKSVRPYMEQKKINYRVMIGDDLTAQHFGGVESLPTTFLVDRSGRIASVHIGLVSKSDYKNEIETLLAAPAETTKAGA